MIGAATLLATAMAIAPAAPNATNATNATNAKRLAVLPTILEGAYGQATVAEVFQAGARGAERVYELEVAPYNVVIVEGETSIADTANDCGADVNCIARALADRNMDAGLRIIVNFALEPPLVSLSLIERGPKRLTAEHVTEIPRGASLDKELERACLTMLEGAGYTRAGKLIISVSPPDANVRVEGEARATPDPRVFIAKPGRLEIAADRADYQSAKSTAVVIAGEEINVALSLEKAAVAEGGLPWLWIALGGAVVAGAATAVIVATDPFSSDPARGCVCITTAAGDCRPCMGP